METAVQSMAISLAPVTVAKSAVFGTSTRLGSPTVLRVHKECDLDKESYCKTDDSRRQQYILDAIFSLKDAFGGAYARRERTSHYDHADD